MSKKIRFQLIFNAVFKLVNWFSPSKKINKLRLGLRYILFLIGSFAILKGLFIVRHMQVNALLFYFPFIELIFFHSIIKHMLTQGFKNNLEQKEIDAKFVKITAIGIILTLLPSFVFIGFSLVFKDYSLYTYAIITLLLNYPLVFLITFFILPKEYRKELSMSGNISTYSANVSNSSNPITDINNPANLNNPSNPIGYTNPTSPSYIDRKY